MMRDLMLSNKRAIFNRLDDMQLDILDWKHILRENDTPEDQMKALDDVIVAIIKAQKTFKLTEEEKKELENYESYYH